MWQNEIEQWPEHLPLPPETADSPGENQEYKELLAASELSSVVENSNPQTKKTKQQRTSRQAGIKMLAMTLSAATVITTVSLTSNGTFLPELAQAAQNLFPPQQTQEMIPPLVAELPKPKPAPQPAEPEPQPAEQAPSPAKPTPKEPAAVTPTAPIRQCQPEYDHNWQVVEEQPATCLEQGWQTQRCKEGDAFRLVILPISTEHCFTDTILPPMENTPGCTVHTCDICGYRYCDNQTPALGGEQETPAQKADSASHKKQPQSPNKYAVVK